MNERQIFEEALEIGDAARREAFLQQACSADVALRQRIASLLAAHDPESRFLEVPAVQQLGDLDLCAPDSTVTLTRSAPGDTDNDDEAPASADLSFLSPSTKPGSIGTLGHYEILDVLGQGGFGIVFRAFDEQLKRPVAIKVLKSQMAATSPPRKRFLREARASAGVRHENVIRVYSVEEWPLPYLVMEFIDGETLQEKLDATGPLEIPEILHIGRQIASGLAAAHAVGLIHRDIKPGNILLEHGAEQKVKITDFGLARAADDASLTRTGMVSGTPLYMSPEQASGAAIDRRSDLFSLGSVLYVLASGRPPFRARSVVAVLKRVVEETPRPIPEIIPEVPDWLCDIITKLHAKQAEDRFESAGEVADLLAHHLAEYQLQNGVESLRHVPPGPSRLRSQQLVSVPESKAPVSADTTSNQVGRNLTKRISILVASVALLMLLAMGLSEASGVTQIGSTIIRLFSPLGTLVVELDDPTVSVTIDGEDLVITGAGVHEIRLTPGRHRVQASKAGKLVREDLVNVTRNGRQLVRVSRENAVPGDNVAIAAPAISPVTFAAPSSWIGTRTYRQGARSVETVSYELYLLKLEEGHCTGVVFESGTGRNRAEVEGEIDGQVIRWRERAGENLLTSRGEIVGDRIRLTFEGQSADGRQYQGDGVLARTSPDRAPRGLPVVLAPGDQGRYQSAPDELMQLNVGTSMLLFGDRDWSDYDVSVETLTVGGTPRAQSGNLIFRSTADFENSYALVVGSFGGTLTDITRLVDRRWGRLTPPRPIKFICDRWYRLDVQLRGSRIVCRVDGQQVFDVEDTSHARGMIGLGTWNSAVKWRNLRVTSPEGVLLWEGFPDIPGDALAAEPDRRAAEYVIGIGGKVRIDDRPLELTTILDLSAEPFQLTQIDLTGNQLVTEPGWAMFRGTRNLREIRIDNAAEVIDQSLAHFRGNKQLTSLSLRGTRVSSAGLANFRDCPDLHSLVLGNTGFTDAEMAFFDTFPALNGLTALDLSDTTVGDAGLAHLRRADGLIQLQLKYTQVTDAGLLLLESFRNLRQLNLSDTVIGDPGLASLQRCGGLREVDVRRTRVTAAGVAALRAELPDCQVISDFSISP